jgi:hypothetical protein
MADMILWSAKRKMDMATSNMRVKRSLDDMVTDMEAPPGWDEEAIKLIPP